MLESPSREEPSHLVSRAVSFKFELYQGCFHSLEVGNKEALFAIAVAILVKPPVKECLFMRLLLQMKPLICPYLANPQRAPVFRGACLPFLPPAGNKKIKMKQLWTIAVILLTVLTECFGQTAWYDPMQTSGSTYIQNQGWNEDGGNYHRFPNRVKDLVRQKVWELSCQ